jgi:hypothetical protein
VTQALKDMLGFTDHHPEPPPPPKRPPAQPPPPPPPMGKVTVGGSGKRPAAPEPPPAAAPGRVVIQQPARAPVEPEPPHDERIGAEEAAQATQEFFRTSPVLAASAKPVERAQPPAAPTPAPVEPARTPAAASLVALAGDIAHLGVPDGQRAVARAMLIELAQTRRSPAASSRC